MNWLSKPRTWIITGVCVAALFLLYQLWHWEVERVEVEPNHFLVKVHLWGKDLPDGEIVAPDESYRGVQRELLTEGRHFLNPILYSYQKHKALDIPNDSCAVLIRKAGQLISGPGEYLSDDTFNPGQPLGTRGIVREVLKPGKHYVNPHEYDVEIVKAVRFEAGNVGVRVLKWGKDPTTMTEAQKKEFGPYVVPEGFRGVQRNPVEPGTYYINPYVEEIVPVDVRSHEVEFTDIVFPSRDGFQIQPHVRVTYAVIASQAPELFVTLAEHGVLFQGDKTANDQKKNPILIKFVLPLIRGVVRIEGSKYEARDYVSLQRPGKGGPLVENPREKLQEELMRRVKPQCQAVGVMIESITVAELEMNPDLQKLANQIAERETTRLAREKNNKLVEQYKQEQELKSTESMKERRQKLVDAELKLKVEITRAKQLKDSEELKLKNELKSAQARWEAAKDQAKLILLQGDREAESLMEENRAEVAGLEKAIAGFQSPEQFAQYHVLSKLSPALAEIFASDNSEFAKVFTTYMVPPRRGNGHSNGSAKSEKK